MGHLYHGYVSHNQRVSKPAAAEPTKGGEVQLHLEALSIDGETLGASRCMCIVYV